MGTLHVSYLPLSQHDTLPSSSCSTVVLFCVVVDSFCSEATTILSSQVSSWFRGAASPCFVCLHESGLRAGRLGGLG